MTIDLSGALVDEVQARELQGLCRSYGVVLRGHVADPPTVLRVELETGGPIGRVDIHGLTIPKLDSLLRSWGLAPKSGLERMREQAAASREARAAATADEAQPHALLTPSLELRQVEALERIADALERLAGR